MKLTDKQTSLIGMALRDKAKLDRKVVEELRAEGGELNLSYVPVFEQQAVNADALADIFDDAPYGATIKIHDGDE